MRQTSVKLQNACERHRAPPSIATSSSEPNLRTKRCCCPLKTSIENQALVRIRKRNIAEFAHEGHVQDPSARWVTGDHDGSHHNRLHVGAYLMALW